MASGFGTSFQKASDIEYDYNCTRCEEKDHNAEALFYCTNCSKLYCDHCDNLHGSFYTDHNVLGKKDVDKWGVVRIEVSMAMCEKHRGKELDMYCKEHNAVCCYICVSDKHLTCKKIAHVPDVAKGIHKKAEFKKFTADMSKMMKQLNEISAGRKRNQKTLQDTCKNIISSLTELTTRVYKLMDKLQKKTIETMDKLLAELDETIQYDVDAYMAIHDEMKKILDMMQDNKGKKSETLAFVGFNKGERKLSEAKHLVQSMPTQQYKISFKEDSSIEQYLSSMEILGDFETTPPSPTGVQSPAKTQQIPPTSTEAKLPAQIGQIPSTSTGARLPAKTCQIPPTYTGAKLPAKIGQIPPTSTGAQLPAKTGQIPPTSTEAKLPAKIGQIPPTYTEVKSPVKINQIYVVINKREYNVCMKDDKADTSITGCCQLSNGQTVICDYANTKVKLLNQQYSVISHCNLPPDPYDVCHIAGTEVAVTLRERDARHEIQLINAGNNQLALTRTIALDHDCYGLAHHADQLYVSSYDALYIYTMAGQLVKKLYEDKSGRAWSTVSRFAVSDDGQKIYVTNCDKHLLITLDNNGRTLATLADPDMQRPKGVCLAGNGTVFVSGYDSHTVVQVSRNGKKKLVTTGINSDGDPQSLWFNRNTSDLIVGQYGTDNLLVLETK